MNDEIATLLHNMKTLALSHQKILTILDLGKQVQTLLIQARFPQKTSPKYQSCGSKP